MCEPKGIPLYGHMCLLIGARVAFIKPERLRLWKDVGNKFYNELKYKASKTTFDLTTALQQKPSLSPSIFKL